MSATDGIALGLHSPKKTQRTPSIPRPTSACSCAPLPASRHDPYQSHGDLCKHYDRLVSDPPFDRPSIASSPPGPSLTSGRSNASPPWPTSPRRSGSVADSSISSEAVFRAFQPGQAEHRHSESCITPMRLMELDKQNRSEQGNGRGSVGKTEWGMSQMGLNVAAGEWRPGVGNGAPGRRW